jgi:hypothetical protein
MAEEICSPLGQPGSRERKSLGLDIPFKGTPLVTYFLQPASHPNRHSIRNPSMG